MQSSVEYLGHTIDAEGLHTSPKNVKAIQEAPIPHNQQELRSFLGLLHYYGKFIPNLATMLHPLNKLLKKGIAWKSDTSVTDDDFTDDIPETVTEPVATDTRCYPQRTR